MSSTTNTNLTEPTVTRWFKLLASSEMAIIPDTKNGPLLEIEIKDQDGVVLILQRLNLVAVEEEIDKLIKMRNHMAQMKGDHGKA